MSAILGPSPETPPSKAPAESRRRWFELLLVLLVAFSGPLTSALSILNAGPGPAQHPRSASWLLGSLHEVISILLLGYVLSRSGRGFNDLGVRWSLRDFGLGVLVYLVSLATYLFGTVFVQLVHYLRYYAYYPGPTAKTIFGHSRIAMIPYILITPFFEELIVRAYLMTEMRDLTGSAVLAAVASVLLQSAYHLYYGWLGALSISFLFIPLAVYYALTRRALPIIVAHGIFDIYGLIHMR